MESYNGVLQSKLDALYLIEAAKMDMIPQVMERFSPFERQRYIRSGSVFIWNENKSNIKRWTDGRKWSASRVSGQFLSYKEMKPPGKGADSCHIVDVKHDGMLKQSFSYQVGQDRYHIVSYMEPKCAKCGSLQRPSTDIRFRGLKVETIDEDGDENDGAGRKCGKCKRKMDSVGTPDPDSSLEKAIKRQKAQIRRESF